MKITTWQLPAHTEAVFYAVPMTDIQLEWLEILSARELHRYKHFSQPDDRQRYLVGRYSLRQLLAERLGISPVQVQLDRSKSGKPELCNGGWCFNLSHSGDWVLIALHPYLSIGVDLEQPRQLRQPIRLLQRLRATAGNALICNLDTLQLWTQAEAALKAVGCGAKGLGELRRQGTDYLWRHHRIKVVELTFMPALAYYAAFAYIAET